MNDFYIIFFLQIVSFFVYFLVEIFVHFMKPLVLTRMTILDANYFYPRSFFALLSHVFHALCAFFAAFRPSFAALRLYSSALRPRNTQKMNRDKMLDIRKINWLIRSWMYNYQFLLSLFDFLVIFGNDHFELFAFFPFSFLQMK